MKRAVIFLGILIGLIGMVFSVNLFKSGSEAISYSDIPNPPEGSQEELYKDMFVTAVGPHIDKAIAEHYGRQLMYGFESGDILNVTRPHGYRTFEFEINLQVKPFVGAHNTAGIDNITIRVTPGQVEVEKFEHIQSFEQPQHLKNLKGTPN